MASSECSMYIFLKSTFSVQCIKHPSQASWKLPEKNLHQRLREIWAMIARRKGILNRKTGGILNNNYIFFFIHNMG